MTLQFFTAPGCKACKWARRWLDQRRIAYRELSLENESNRFQLANAYASAGIPSGDFTVPSVVFAGPEGPSVMQGFSPDKWERLFSPSTGQLTYSSDQPAVGGRGFSPWIVVALLVIGGVWFYAPRRKTWKCVKWRRPTNA